jgi:plasmid stability protein
MLKAVQEVSSIKNLTVRLDDELHKAFKIYSINQGKDMQEILREYIKSLTEKPQEKE